MFVKTVEYENHRGAFTKHDVYFNTDHITHIIEHPDENLWEVVLSSNDTAVWLGAEEFAQLKEILKL